MVKPTSPTSGDNTPAHSEDPAVIMVGSETVDDLETRVRREVPEEIEVAEDGGFRLIEPRSAGNDGPTMADQEASLVSDERSA